MYLEIICSPELPARQVQVLRKTVAGDGVGVSQQCSEVSGDAIIIGTVILSMGFAAKAFFDSFFKEAGKDAYIWLKSKLALRKAEEIQPILVMYSLHVAEIYFSDERFAEFEIRHTAFPNAVSAVLAEIERLKIDNVEAVKLHYDEHAQRYLKADLFESAIVPVEFDEEVGWRDLREPLAVITIPEDHG